MNIDQTINVLQEAKHEISQLRRQNEILSAKVEVMNLFATVLHTQPAYPGGQCMSVDIKHSIEQLIANLQTEQLPKETPPTIS